jgi:hypothetical protein
LSKPVAQPRSVKKKTGGSRRKPSKGGSAGKPGRPSAFDERLAAAALVVAKKGGTDEEIAEALGVDVRTLYRWKGSRNDFCQALKESKALADELVEASLWHRAVGFSHPAVKVHFDKFGQPSEHPYTEHYPPDTAAAIFWLQNRQADRWKVKQAHELSGPNGGPIKTQQMTAAEVAEAAAKAVSAAAESSEPY